MDVELNLNSETVAQLGARAPLCVDPATSVRDVLTALADENTGTCLVCRDGALVGIFTERDAVRFMAARGGLETPIGEVMTSCPMTVRPHETIGAAIRKMSDGGYRRLPVIDDTGRPVGLVKVSAVVHYLVQHFPKAVYNLPPTAVQLQDREGP